MIHALLKKQTNDERKGTSKASLSENFERIFENVKYKFKHRTFALVGGSSNFKTRFSAEHLFEFPFGNQKWYFYDISSV